jgi:FtsH-binding integral membrane protein
MSVTDYVIDILLILVIFRAVRPHPLTPRAALLPLVLLAIAGIIYLRPITLGGNDLALILILAAAGVILGALSGLADRIWRDEQRRLLSRATIISVIAWVVGMGFRFGFAYYAYHGGGPAVARFSIQHQLSGGNIWTTALVLMAFGQVLARLAILQIRRVRAARDEAALQHWQSLTPPPDASLAAHRSGNHAPTSSS